MHIIFYVSVLVGLCYVLLMLYLAYGWLSLGDYHRDYHKPYTSVSVILPMRNEEQNILTCLASIALQDYPADKFEVLVIDDQSEDRSVDLVKEFIDAHPEKTIRLINQKQVTGKKAILALGVQRANGKLIVCTDADCTVGEQWLSTLVNYYETYGVAMLAGPVCMDGEKNIFEQMQSLEFISMIGTTASTITLDQPLMCNGANMAFEKDAYMYLGAAKTGSKFASGDDVFLLKQIRHKLKERIGFVKSQAAIVSTKAQPTLKEFINQRIRWASKSKGYTDVFSLITAFTVLLFSLSIPMLLLCGIFQPLFLRIALLLFMIKLVVDLPVMAGTALFLNKSRLLIWYLPVQMLYIFYISWVGFFSTFKGFYWKQRYYKK